MVVDKSICLDGSAIKTEGEFMRPISRDTIFLPAKSTAVLTVFCFALLFGHGARAEWLGPNNAPPLDNVAAPLSEDTNFGGGTSALLGSSNIVGKYNNLQIKIDPCEAGKVLMWGAVSGVAQVVCGDPVINTTLLEVLNNDADASGYRGGVVLGSSTATWLNVGGALTSSWIHATSSGNNSIAGNLSIGGKLGVGTVAPKSQLHVYNDDPEVNAEIGIQSISGDNNHWAIYNDHGTNDLRFWNADPVYDGYSGADYATARNNSLVLTSLGQVVVGGLFGDRTADNWSKRKFIVTGNKLSDGSGTSTVAYFSGPVTDGDDSNAYWASFLTRKIPGTAYADDDWRYSESRLQFGMDNSLTGYIANRAAFADGWNQVMVLGNTQDVLSISRFGNVGIGTMQPVNKLEVNGAITIDSSDPANKDAALYNFNGDLYWRNQKISSNGSEYVGVTSAGADGSNGGYVGANALCSASHAGSHVCTTNEILNTINSGLVSLFDPLDGESFWISNGAPGSTANLGNDCIGWTSGNGADIGVIWTFDSNGGSGGLTSCNSSLPFACCK